VIEEEKFDAYAPQLSTRMFSRKERAGVGWYRAAYVSGRMEMSERKTDGIIVAATERYMPG
jgi:hypothetical protein